VADMLDPRAKRAAGRSKLLIAYLFLVFGAVLGFFYMQVLTERVDRAAEARSYDNCLASNESREVISQMLNVLLVSGEGRRDAEQQARALEIYAELQELAAPRECPPSPYPEENS